jgi:hypothetical protein
VPNMAKKTVPSVIHILNDVDPDWRIMIDNGRTKEEGHERIVSENPM